MNELQQQPENGKNRALTIAAFVAVIVFLLWLAVQVVGLLPNAFTSLASLADSLYGPDKRDIEIVLTNENAIVDQNTPFELSWSAIPLTGQYYFSYTCEDGVSLQVEYPKGTIRDLACDEALNIGNSTSLSVLALSNENRFADVNYTLEFIDTEDFSVRKKAHFTVVNKNIGLTNDTGGVDGQVAGATSTVDVVIDPEVVVEVPAEPVVEEVPAEPATPATQPAPVTPTYTYVEVPVYAIPTSDPNGFTDLQMKLIGTGQLTGNTFFATPTIDEDAQGAIRFTITNLGTKTSEPFTFKAELPNGQIFESNEQKPLKPNETATLTLGFSGFEDTGAEDFSVTLDIDNDTNRANNSIAGVVVITN